MRTTCRCGTTWVGPRVQHCSTGCHQTFANVTVGDAHRTADGWCLSPDQMRALGWWQNDLGQWDR